MHLTTHTFNYIMYTAPLNTTHNKPIKHNTYITYTKCTKYITYVTYIKYITYGSTLKYIQTQQIQLKQSNALKCTTYMKYNKYIKYMDTIPIIDYNIHMKCIRHPRSIKYMKNSKCSKCSQIR